MAAVEMYVPSQSSCFQLFGFDVLIDDTLKPWLLEVNFSPSLNVDQKIDMQIKSPLIAELFNLTGIVPRPGKKSKAAKAQPRGGQEEIRGVG